MKENKASDSMIRRMDAILRLLLERLRETNEDLTIGDQLLILQDAGLTPAEAGNVLGIESTQLTKYVKAAKNQKLRKKVEKRRAKSRK